MAIQRYKMVLAYDGTDFHGWQRQMRPDGTELRTVQGVVGEALTRVLGQPVRLQGASRTDSGVHAQGQVAHFDAETRVPLERMAKAFNSRLPEDVEVRCVSLAHPAFDATRDALEKQYRYRVWASRSRPLGHRHRVYHCWVELDLAPMNDAAARLVGEHDFAAFAAAGHGRESTVRTLYACHVEEQTLNGVRQLHMVVRGNGFLYNMVRIIAGTLLEVGRGRFEPSHIDRLLSEEKIRHAAGPTLPPQGLCLEWIRYPEA